MTASKVARRLTLHQPQLRDRHTDLDAAAAMIVLVLVLDLDAVVPPASTDADHWLLDTLHDQYHSAPISLWRVESVQMPARQRTSRRIGTSIREMRTGTSRGCSSGIWALDATALSATTSLEHYV